jgi:hypothetical protein
MPRAGTTRTAEGVTCMHTSAGRLQASNVGWSRARPELSASTSSSPFSASTRVSPLNDCTSAEWNRVPLEPAARVVRWSA